MAAVDPGMPITFVRTLKEEVSNYFTQQRFIARLTSFYGKWGIYFTPVAPIVCGFRWFHVPPTIPL